MKASIHLTDLETGFPVVDTTEDQTTGIHDAPGDSKAYNFRTLLMMFIVVVRAGNPDAILEDIKTQYREISQAKQRGH